MPPRRIIILIALALAGCGPVSDRSRNAFEASGEIVALSGGDAGPAGACFRCHGLRGAGDGDATPRLAGLDSGYLQKQLEDYASGVRADPTMGPIAARLTPRARARVAAHYAAIAYTPPSISAPAPGVYANGDPARGLAPCAVCHGPTGRGAGRGNPAIAGQPAAYTHDQLQRFAKAQRRNDARAIMRTAAAALTAAERAAIAAWLASPIAVPGPADDAPPARPSTVAPG